MRNQILWGTVAISSFSVTSSAFATLETHLQIRPRAEFVDDGVLDRNDDGVDDTDNALAVTTRVALGVKIPSTLFVANLSTHLEFISVSSQSRQYNSTSDSGNFDPSYALVVDPPLTRVSEAYLRYDFNRYTSITAGRKKLSLDDHRFIGNVDWRQMPQSFGLVELKYEDDHGFVQLDYLYERLGIKDEFNASYKKGSLVFHSLYKAHQAFNISLFHYALQDLHDTSGAKLTGDLANFHYELTYAYQGDPSRADDDSIEVDSEFKEIEFGLKLGIATLKLNYHTLGSALNGSERGFATPFATLHKFDGWSDTLLGLAANGTRQGLEVASVGTKVKTRRGTFGLYYLDFNSVIEDLDYGSEVDFVYTNKIKPNLVWQLKSAYYMKADDSPTDDRTIVWLMLTSNFTS